jgi:hypothetical protein
MGNIKVQRIMETTFEDGTVWVEYRILDKDKVGYMISNKITTQDSVESVEKKLNELVSDQLSDKPLHDDYEEPIKSLILECLQSENEMWFVEFEDLEEDFDVPENLHDDYLDRLDEDIEKVGLSDYIKIKEDGCAITVYGGVITMCLF